MTANTSYPASGETGGGEDETQRDVHGSLPGDEAHALVAKGSEAPLAAEGALAVEGTAAAERESAEETGAEAVRALLFSPGVEPRVVALDEVPALAQVDRDFVWVDLAGYRQEDLQHIADLLVLPRDAVQTTLAEWRRPRLHVFGDRLYVTATVPQLDPEAYRVEAQQLDVFLGPNFLVSAHKRPLPFGQRVLARARQNPTLLEQDAIFLLYIILDELVGYYEQVHEHLENEIERVEERALDDTSDEFLHDLVRFKRYAFALSQLADQHRPIFDAFLRPDLRWVDGQEVEPYYRDLDDRLGRLTDALQADKEAINGAFDIYVSHMSHRTNNIMKTLTIVSTVLLPASVILGFFGTNNVQEVPLLVHTPGFFLMLGSIMAISVAILLAFRAKGWL
ncbi:MAG TPA: magnesium transporter CorA family protein [Ktedonobacterales bacterium]|nr:magnesium transporter CorA family protein [Ktedonobacterales bacterium]